jgi:hypothetical protein
MRMEEAPLTRVTKNLSLDAAAVERGERFSARHSKSLSQVVSDLLLKLPMDEEDADYSPAVRRLLGIVEGSVDEKDCKRHLTEKYDP